MIWAFFISGFLFATSLACFFFAIKSAENVDKVKGIEDKVRQDVLGDAMLLLKISKEISLTKIMIREQKVFLSRCYEMGNATLIHRAKTGLISWQDNLRHLRKLNNTMYFILFKPKQNHAIFSNTGEFVDEIKF